MASWFFSLLLPRSSLTRRKVLFWLSVQGAQTSPGRSHGTRERFFTIHCLRQQRKRSAGSQLAASCFPMHSDWDASQRDGAAHIQGFPRQLALYENTLMDTPEGVLQQCPKHFFIWSYWRSKLNITLGMTTGLVSELVRHLAWNPFSHPETIPLNREHIFLLLSQHSPLSSAASVGKNANTNTGTSYFLQAVIQSLTRCDLRVPGLIWLIIRGDTAHHGEEGRAEGAGGCWSPCIHTQEAESGQEVGSGDRSSRFFIVIDFLQWGWLHLLKVPPPDTAPPAGSKRFNAWASGGHFALQQACCH